MYIHRERERERYKYIYIYTYMCGGPRPHLGGRAAAQRAGRGLGKDCIVEYSMVYCTILYYIILCYCIVLYSIV